MVVNLEKYRKTRKISRSLEISMGERIMIARKNQGISQEELGDRLGYSQSVISRMETGTLDIWPDDMAGLAIALNNTGLLQKYCAECPVARAQKEMRCPRPVA